MIKAEFLSLSNTLAQQVTQQKGKLLTKLNKNHLMMKLY